MSLWTSRPPLALMPSSPVSVGAHLLTFGGMPPWDPALGPIGSGQPASLSDVGRGDDGRDDAIVNVKPRAKRMPKTTPAAGDAKRMPKETPAQPAILSELLCILGAEGCVVYVSRIGLHMRRSFVAGALQGCCWSSAR